MSHTERNPDGRFQPGRSGNPAGRPPGARNRISAAVDAMIEGEAEEVTRKVLELASYGHVGALRMCLERVAPRRKGRSVAFALPPIEHAGDAVAAGAVILAAMASGELSPDEATERLRAIEAFQRVCQHSELGERVAELEARLAESEAARWAMDPTSLNPGGTSAGEGMNSARSRKNPPDNTGDLHAYRSTNAYWLGPDAPEAAAAAPDNTGEIQDASPGGADGPGRAAAQRAAPGRPAENPPGAHRGDAAGGPRMTPESPGPRVWRSG